MATEALNATVTSIDRFIIKRLIKPIVDCSQRTFHGRDMHHRNLIMITFLLCSRKKQSVTKCCAVLQSVTQCYETFVTLFLGVAQFNTTLYEFEYQIELNGCSNLLNAY